MKSSRITIKDIARIAEVVPSTVSAVLNGKEKSARISSALSDKIKKIADDMGYQPNSMAVSLRTGKSRIIGLIVENISNPFFALLAKELEDEIYKYHYRILYCSTENNDEKGAGQIKMLYNRQADGFIIAPSSGMNKSIKQLMQTKVPIVLIDRYFPELEVASTLVDNYKGVELGMKHLIEKGYKNIGFISVDINQAHMTEREIAYRNELELAGIKPNEKFQLKINYTIENKKEVIKKFLKENSALDAVFFATNYLCIAGLEAIADLEIQIPTQLAVICFDDHDLFHLFSPKITAVSQPIAEIAKSAVKLLVNQFDTKKYPVRSKEQILLAPKLIVRASS